jgi:hypothetical protein
MIPIQLKSSNFNLNCLSHAIKVQSLKLYDYIILDLEWPMIELLGVISFASYIQEWR